MSDVLMNHLVYKYNVYRENKTVFKSLQQTVYGKCMTNNTDLCVEHTNQSLKKKIYTISERRKTRSFDILRYAERLHSIHNILYMQFVFV